MLLKLQYTIKNIKLLSLHTYLLLGVQVWLGHEGAVGGSQDDHGQEGQNVPGGETVHLELASWTARV